MIDRAPGAGPLVCALLAGACAALGVPSLETPAARSGAAPGLAAPLSAFTPGAALAQTAEKGTQERMPALEVLINLDDVDLEKGRLLLRMSRPAARVTLKVIALSGAVLAEVSRDFDAAPAGSELVMQWPVPQQTANEPVVATSDPIARIEVFGYDTSGYHKGVAISAWSFEIPHAEVVFETDSAEIRPSEASKLRDSLARINAELSRARHLGTITLFIVAHTDTVGSSDYNEKLSTRRAQAIARWFRGNGLKIPIAYDGVGERALQVKTADEVDEPRNRHVDYWLSPQPRRFKGSGVMPDWKRL